MATLATKKRQTLSWGEIKELVNQGAAEHFSVGDEITQELTNGKTAVFAVIGVNHYQDGEIVLRSKDCIGTSHRMNKRATNKGGWKASYGREYMNGEEFTKLFPDDLLAVISKKKTVQMIQGETVECEDTFWLPSEYEVFGEESYAEYNGTDKQFPYYTERRNRITFDENGCWEWGWLASPSGVNATAFCTVSYSGHADTTDASDSFGVAPGFVIRKS